MKHKRYLVFELPEYDAPSGMEGVVDSFDSLEQARFYITDKYYKLSKYEWDTKYFEIYDRIEGESVEFQIPAKQGCNLPPVDYVQLERERKARWDKAVEENDIDTLRLMSLHGQLKLGTLTEIRKYPISNTIGGMVIIPDYNSNV